jgi:Tfp pilus assembly protein PilF/uncharacterized protein (AIM24 family)
VIESSRASRPAAARNDDDARLFDEDDADLTENQEFDKALAEGSEALQGGEAARAKVLLEKALRHKPRNQRARNLLGLSLFKLGELEKAESLYRGLIEDHPADPTLRVNLGLVFLKSGASSDAVRCFETTLDLQPDHSKAQNYLGLALAQKGDHAKARDWFVKCGNAPMAERMTAALQASPIRDVAEGAAESLAGEQPFTSALESAPKAGSASAAEPVDDAPAVADEPAEVKPARDVAAGAISTPPQGSRWVATAPAVEAPAVRPLARLALRSRGGGSPPSSPSLPLPDREVLADAHAAAALVEEDDARHRAAKAAADTNPTIAPVAKSAPPSSSLSEDESQAVARAAADHAAVHTPESPAPESAAAPQAPQAPVSTPPAERPAIVSPVSAPPVPVDGFVQTPPLALAAYTASRRMQVPAGDGGFLVGATEAVVQVHGELLTRLDGLVASWGTAALKPELKRFRGKATDKPFGEGARRMLRATGDGRYVIAREGRCFTALELGDEPAYFREEILFAFEESLVFENGRVPSKVGTDLHLVHLRGRGKLLLVTAGSPRSVEVNRGEPLRIPMDQLVGWHGPLIQPRLVPIVEEAPELGVALELSGEGRALVDAPEGR